MSLTKEEIKSAALKLDPVEREALAEELLLSVDGAEREAIDSAWLTEVQRRDQELRAGGSSIKPVDEVIERLKSRKRA